jgi:large subunit ribosomal protein L1
MGRGKRYREIAARIERTREYSLQDAVQLVKENARAKFDETVEIAINLNLKKGHTVRDTVVLPHQFGKEKRILVFAQGEKADEASEAGATYVGGADLVQKIQGGWLDFDVAVATPDMMRDVGKLGPILGRRGLMPNPKTGTVTMDVAGAIAELRQGRMEFRADKTGVVNMSVGKASMDAEKIAENATVFIDEVTRRRPADLRGQYIRSVSCSSTMGPGVKISVSAGEED